jgi:hypothetical protein
MQSTRIAQPPARRYEKFGFGLGGIASRSWEERRRSVQLLREIYDRQAAPSWTDEQAKAVSTVRGMFWNIRSENSYDWFTLSRFFGLPSGKVAGKTQKKLREAAEWLSRGDQGEFEAALDELEEFAFGEMLDAYLAATRPRSPEFHAEPHGWVALIWTSSSRDETKVVASAGRPQTLLPKNENCDPYGLLAAWNVSDAHHAREELGAMFHDFLEIEALPIPRGTARLLEIKHSIEAMLYREDLLVLSPWHARDTGPETAVPAPAPEQLDDNGRVFAASVSDVFSAFRR